MEPLVALVALLVVAYALAAARLSRLSIGPPEMPEPRLRPRLEWVPQEAARP